MTEQLTLVNVERADWVIDMRTREAGKRGVAAARALLEGPAKHDLKGHDFERDAA